MVPTRGKKKKKGKEKAERASFGTKTKSRNCRRNKANEAKLKVDVSDRLDKKKHRRWSSEKKSLGVFRRGSSRETTGRGLGEKGI